MNMLALNKSTRQRQAGATLIELLVSFVIFSFGILGLVGLQSKLLVYNQSSLFRSQATALADDVLERMRVDLVNARSSSSPWSTAKTTVATSVTDNADLQDWKLQVEALLPAGTASIVINANEVTVELEWNDDRTQNSVATASLQKFLTVSRL
jgi:type IV pilus assembly protein PilV